MQNTTNEAPLKKKNDQQGTKHYSGHQQIATPNISLGPRGRSAPAEVYIGPENPEISLGSRVIVGKFSTTFLSKM